MSHEPGLGSKALREALCEALDCINDNIDLHGTEWADRPMTQWMSDWRLSLSSPIEPPHCNAPNPDGSYLCNKEPHSTGDHVHSFINADKQNDFYFWPAQASSEIRETLTLRNKLLDEGVQRMGSVLAEYSGPERENRPFLLMCQEWIDAAERALAPSRQGAAKRVAGWFHDGRIVSEVALRRLTRRERGGV